MPYTVEAPIAAVNRRTHAGTGRTWAVVHLDDGTDTLEAKVPPMVYKRCATHMVEGVKVRVTGKHRPPSDGQPALMW